MFEKELCRLGVAEGFGLMSQEGAAAHESFLKNLGPGLCYGKPESRGSGKAPVSSQRMRWGAMTLKNSLEVMILVFFQNLGKWR
jgi:hypothetical protein